MWITPQEDPHMLLLQSMATAAGLQLPAYRVATVQGLAVTEQGSSVVAALQVC